MREESLGKEGRIRDTMEEWRESGIASECQERRKGKESRREDWHATSDFPSPLSIEHFRLELGELQFFLSPSMREQPLSSLSLLSSTDPFLSLSHLVTLMTWWGRDCEKLSEWFLSFWFLFHLCSLFLSPLIPLALKDWQSDTRFLFYSNSYSRTWPTNLKRGRRCPFSSFSIPSSCLHCHYRGGLVGCDAFNFSFSTSSDRRRDGIKSPLLS